jgi:tetratricopeptide (TPR) repeat protein
MHHQALDIFIKSGDPIWAARTYHNLGYLYRRRGDRAKAMEAYSNVESIITDGEGYEMCKARINLARAYLDLGEVELSREHAFKAHEETDSLGDSSLHARARAVLGRYYAKVNDADLALHHYSEALELMGEAGDPLALVETTLLLGEVLVDSGRTEEALEQFRELGAKSRMRDVQLLVHQSIMGH